MAINKVIYGGNTLIDLTGDTVTAANSNAFSNLQADCIIYVPSGSLEAYTSAANYPSSSSYTYMEE